MEKMTLRLTITVLVALAVLLASCAPAAPPPAPTPSKTEAPAKTAEPAKATEAPKAPAAPAATKAPEPAKPAAAPAPKAEVPEVTTVRIGALPIASLAPFYIAEMNGYFKDEGLTIEKVPQFGAQGLTVLESGKMDLNFGDVVSTIVALSKGFKFVMVAPASSARDAPPDSSAIAVLKDSGIKRPKDLEGKRVAVDALQAMNWMYMRTTIEKDGGDPNKVAFAELPHAQMGDSLLNKQVAAANVAEPAHSLLLKTGKVEIIGYPLVGNQSKMDISMIVAKEDWAKNNPITLKKFLRAYGKGIEFVNKEEAKARKMTAEFARLDPAVADNMLLPAFRMQVQPDQMDKSMDLMVKYGVLDKKIDINKFIWPTALNMPK